MAKTNVCKGSEIGDDFKVGPESRVEEAHVNIGAIQYEPITPFLFLSKLEEKDGSVIRQIFLPHQPVQDPDQKVGVEVLVAEITSRPLVPPGSQGLDYRAELPTRGGQMVFEASPICDWFPLDNPGVG